MSGSVGQFLTSNAPATARAACLGQLPLKPRRKEAGMRNRNIRIVFYLTEEEYRRLSSKVESSGLSREAFIRRTLDNKTVVEYNIDVYPDTITQLRQTGNVLHQMLLQSRSRCSINTKALEEAINDNRAAEKRVVEAFTKAWQ